MPDDPYKLGKRIWQIRSEKGLSLTQVYERGGISRMHISNIELGKRYPTEQTLVAIAKGLDVQPELLLEVFEPRSRRSMTVDERFWDQVYKTDNCWVWLGHTNDKGYGYFSYLGKEVKAHRMAWVLVMGDIPANADLDHRCTNRLCVNPDHLEPTTRFINQSRRHMREKDELIRRATKK